MVIIILVSGIGLIFHSCSKDSQKSYSNNHLITKSIPDSLTSKIQVERWFLNNILRDTIDLKGNILETITLGQVDNKRNLIQLQGISENARSIMVTFFKALISQKYSISKDSIEEDTCSSCNGISGMPHFGPFYIFYNNLKNQNDEFIPIANQIVSLDFHCKIKNGTSNPLRRMSSIWLNVSTNGTISFGPYQINQLKSTNSIGIAITWGCWASGSSPCGCCTYYYAHWYSILRTCDCHLGGQGGCSNGECTESCTVTILL